MGNLTPKFTSSQDPNYVPLNYEDSPPLQYVEGMPEEEAFYPQQMPPHFVPLEHGVFAVYAENLEEMSYLWVDRESTFFKFICMIQSAMQIKESQIGKFVSEEEFLTNIVEIYLYKYPHNASKIGFSPQSDEDNNNQRGLTVIDIVDKKDDDAGGTISVDEYSGSVSVDLRQAPLEEAENQSLNAASPLRNRYNPAPFGQTSEEGVEGVEEESTGTPKKFLAVHDTHLYRLYTMFTQLCNMENTILFRLNDVLNEDTRKNGKNLSILSETKSPSVRDDSKKLESVRELIDGAQLEKIFKKQELLFEMISCIQKIEDIQKNTHVDRNSLSDEIERLSKIKNSLKEEIECDLSIITKTQSTQK